MKIKELATKISPKKFNLEPAILVLFIYLMLLFSRFVISGIEVGINQYLAIVILQLLTFVIPAALWFRIRSIKKFALEPEKRIKYTERLRLTPPKVGHILIIFAAILALAAGCLLFSINFKGESSLEGSFTLYDTFAAKKDGTALGAIGLILAYAVLPAVCEELVFRGIVCAEYEKHGVFSSFVLNVLWFALLHFNPEKLLTYLFAGIVLTALLYATRSLWACVIAHFMYNMFGLFGQQYITEFYVNAGNLGVFLFIMAALLLLSAAIFCGQAGRLYGKYAKNDPPAEHNAPGGIKEILGNLLTAVKTPAAILCLLVWIAAVIVLAII